jgi:hypothetical protein
MAKQKISELAAAATLTGAEVVIVNQSGVTKKSTVTDVQAIPLAAAVAAQTTADAKLATVAVDGTTITGDGTVGDPLVANVSIPPKEYRGYLTISGSTITPTIFQNDIGNIVWTKPSNGVLQGNLVGAFPDNKCWIIAGLFQGGNIYYPSAVVYPADFFYPNAFVQIDIVKNDGSQTSTPNGTFAIHLIINN